MQIKLEIIILLILVSLLVVGCVEKQGIIIPDTYDEINNNIFVKCSPQILDRTACNEYVEKHINGNYINWSGEISDVRDGLVYVQLPKKMIVLHDVNLELKKGQRIRFQARITIETHLTEGYNYYNTWAGLNKIDLYDAHIQLE